MAASDRLTVRVIGDNAYVRMSDARKHLSTIIEQVLEKHPRVILEKRGVPVAVLSKPESEDDLAVEEEW